MNKTQLKNKRLLARISQSEIAEVMNTHRTYISHVETGIRELTTEFEQRYLTAIETIKTKNKKA